jgi:peptidoglycan DL-endopeptidase CwlO
MAEAGLPPHLARPRTRLLGLAALGVLAAALATLTAPAGSQSIEDKRAEAAEVHEQIEALHAEYDMLEEDAAAAGVELEEVQARITDAEEDLAATQAERDARAGELASYSVDAYVGGPGQNDITAVLNSDEEEVPVRLGYLGSVAGDREQLIEDLDAAEEDVAFQVGELEENEAEAQALVDEIEQKRAEAQARLDEQQEIEDSLDAEIAGLVAEQEAAQAAATQAAAEAEAATGGGGGGGAPPPAGPPPSVSPGAAGAVAAAQSAIGVPYVWAGMSMSGFDCSGLTAWAWGAAGRSLPHSSSAQYGATRRVSQADLQPGDLVFYYSPISHVAMYVGGGSIIDAPSSGGYVSQRSMYAPGSPSGFGRP